MSKCGLLNLTLVGLFTLSPLLWATDSTPAAPIPPQIFSAKKIFIANANDDCLSQGAIESGCTHNAFYNEFYAAMKKWGHFDLASSPAEADLVFELSSYSLWLPADRGASFDAAYKLMLIDARTHFTIWSFVVHPEMAVLSSNRFKNHGLARAQIVTDLKVLFPPADNVSK